MKSNDQENVNGGLGGAIWLILFFMVMFFVSYMGRAITGPLLPALEHNLGISHAEAGGLFVFLFLGYILSLLGSGFVAAVLGHRRTIVLSAVGVGVTLLAVAATNSLWALRVGLFAAGLASGIYLPSGIAALTALVSPTHWGKAIGIHDIAPSLSLVVAPALAGLLLGWTSWRGGYFVFGCVAVLLGFAFSRFGPLVRGRGQMPNYTAVKTLIGHPSLWIMSILFSLAAAGVHGVYNMLPLYLTTEHGFQTSSANFVVALSRVPGLGMVLLAGWATDFFGPRKAIAIVLASSGCLCALLGVASGAALVVAIFVQSAVAISFFPVGLAAVSKLFPLESRNLAISVVGACSGFVGGGVISALMGLMADWGVFGIGLVLNGVLVLTGLAFLPFLHLRPDSFVSQRALRGTEM